MKNKELLKRQIIYRSMHRGYKEMDLLLGNFVKKYVHVLENDDLADLKKILLLEDQIIYDWYFKKKKTCIISKTRVSTMLKNFKL